MKKAGLILFCFPALCALGAQTNVVAIAPAAPGSPVLSFFRVIGALIMVLALFLGAVYLFKNWQRLLIKKGGRQPRLHVVEVRSLGPRQALYVIAYEEQRLLIASSPAGISMLTPLPQEPFIPPGDGAVPVTGSFAEALLRTVSLRK